MQYVWIHEEAAYANAFLCVYMVGVLQMCSLHAFVCISWCIYGGTEFVFILILCWWRASRWSSAVRCWLEHYVQIYRYHRASHTLSIVSSVQSQGILLGWNTVQAMTWHTASVTPAGALSCLSRPSLRCMCVYLCDCTAEEEIQWVVHACTSVCVTVPQAEQNMAHRRAVTGGE